MFAYILITIILLKLVNPFGSMLLSVQEKEKQQCIQLQNTSYILLLSVCFKKRECTYDIIAISHKPKRQSNKTLKTHSVQYFLIAFNCLSIILKYLSLVMRKPDFCICENKDADQLRGNLEADQCLCFFYTHSTIPLLPNYEITSL